MPYVKIHVDHRVWSDHQAALTGAIPALRTLVCAGFRVDLAACHLLLVPTHGAGDQPGLAVEIHAMPKPDRTKASLAQVCENLVAHLLTTTGERAAVRVWTLDPDSYLALK